MKKLDPRADAFTLIELLCVIGIIALLSSLLFPAVGEVRKHADSVVCASNLRQIGICVNLYLADHDNTYPEIETDPAFNVYAEGTTAKPMLETFQQYGMQKEGLRCPADVKGPNVFATKGNSYEWRPMLDDELKTNPMIYTPRGAMRVSPARMRQVIDATPVHNSRQNALYGDGRVRNF
jgi:prepilin-type N-terminal cleavage/methylation domain-containing protein